MDKTHLQTVELEYYESGSLDDSRWRSLIGIDCAYTYGPTYARVQREYNRPSFLPVVMIEAGYESEQNNGSISRGDPEILRRQEYWSMLSGATGQFYGNHYTWQFIDGWKSHLNTEGSAQLGQLIKLFAQRPWFRLVPDQQHRILTAGYGTYTTTGNVGSSDYATAASTPDGTLAIAYLPDRRTRDGRPLAPSSDRRRSLVRSHERLVHTDPGGGARQSRAPSSSRHRAPTLPATAIGSWCSAHAERPAAI